MKRRTRLVENPELFIGTDFLVATAATRWRVALDVHRSPIHHLAMVASASGRWRSCTSIESIHHLAMVDALAGGFDLLEFASPRNDSARQAA